MTAIHTKINSINKIVSVLLFAVFVVNASTAQQKNDQQIVKIILSKSKNAILNCSSISYEYDYKSKFLNRNDTSHYYGSTVLEPQNTDTILGCAIFIKNNYAANGMVYSFDAFYNGIKTYSINHHNQTVTIDDSEKNGTLQSNGKLLTGNMIYSTIMHIYADKNPFTNIVAANSRVDLLGIEKYDGMDCYKIKFNQPNSTNTKHNYTIYYIDKEEYLPRRRITRTESNQQTEYNDLKLSNIILNTSKPTEPQEFPRGYNIEYYTPLEEKKPILLPNGIQAPEVNITSFSTGEKITLDKLKGKVVLLDFWYMNCFPCKKAMPQMEQLHQKYKDKGLCVVGINPIDKTNSADEIKTFLSKQQISYINTSDFTKTTSSNYQVTGYPTVYVLDKTGRIVFSYVGYAIEKELELEKLIEQLLEQP